jgi:hypothetical protein
MPLNMDADLRPFFAGIRAPILLVVLFTWLAFQFNDWELGFGGPATALTAAAALWWKHRQLSRGLGMGIMWILATIGVIFLGALVICGVETAIGANK